MKDYFITSAIRLISRIVVFIKQQISVFYLFKHDIQDTSVKLTYKYIATLLKYSNFKKGPGGSMS
jgi:hypothetical protein